MRPATRGGTSDGSRPATSSGRENFNKPTASSGPGIAASGNAILEHSDDECWSETDVDHESAGERKHRKGDQSNDEEDENSTDDEDDIFAFAPPGMGVSVQLTSSGLGSNPYLEPSQPLSRGAGAGTSTRPIARGDQTFYLDDSTGAMYDAEGRFVRMPSAKMPTPPPASHSGAAGSRYDTSAISSPGVGDCSSGVEGGCWQISAEGSRSFSRWSSPEKSQTSLVGNLDPCAIHRGRGPQGMPLPEELHDDRVDRYYKAAKQKSMRSLASAGKPMDPFREGHPEAAILKLQQPACSQFLIAEGGDAGRLYCRSAGHMASDTVFAGSNDHMTVVGRLEKPIRVVELELDEEEDSPYPEVRASVSNVDDPTMPVMTFRMWFLSLFLTSIVSAANVILNARYPSPQIMPVIIQVISYPMGKGLAKILPIKTYHLPWWLGGYSFCLNPGAWNIKEHTLVCIAINLAASQAYAIYVLFALELPGFYGLQYPTLFSILFILSSQILGFGLSGFCRKFLVRPASMIWPQNLATTTILNTLHAEEESLDGSMSRWKFFCVISLLSFFSWFLPGFLFQALSTFSWVCWIWPENAAVNTIFGVASGLGASFLTFDWTQISFIANPLIVPWWAQMNAFAGFTLAFYIVATSMYFSNAWNTAYFPIISSLSYDRYGHQYNVTRIAPDHIHLDKEAYESYSPLYLSAGLIVCYFSGFAVLTSVLVHTALYHGKSIMNGLRFSQVEEDDVHAKFMRKYPQVPDWWYAAVLISCFVMAIIANAAYDTGLPVWALALSILIPAIYMLPMGFMFAMTGLTMGTNLISEVVSGYLLPGRPIAGMIFKTYGLQSLVTGLNFTQELKLGHYMKVPPRAIFIVQMVCTAISALIQVFVKKWMIKSIPELCSSYQPNRFTCPAYHVFHTASLIWGVVGPQRMFGKGSLYYPVFYGLVCGLIAPFPFWLLSKRNRKSWYRFVSLPVVFAGINYLPPSMGINYTSFILCGFAFQYLIRKHRFRWWSKYNFVTASALDFGTVLSTLFIFFTLNLPKNGTISVNWWGNEVFLNTADAQHRPLRRAPHDGFGPFPKY